MVDIFGSLLITLQIVMVTVSLCFAVFLWKVIKLFLRKIEPPQSYYSQTYVDRTATDEFVG